MEALTAVSVALLNIWDVVKAYEKDKARPVPLDEDRGDPRRGEGEEKRALLRPTGTRRRRAGFATSSSRSARADTTGRPRRSGRSADESGDLAQADHRASQGRRRRKGARPRRREAAQEHRLAGAEKERPRRRRPHGRDGSLDHRRHDRGRQAALREGDRGVRGDLPLRELPEDRRRGRPLPRDRGRREGEGDHLPARLPRRSEDGAGALRGRDSPRPPPRQRALTAGSLQCPGDHDLR